MFHVGASSNVALKSCALQYRPNQASLEDIRWCNLQRQQDSMCMEEQYAGPGFINFTILPHVTQTHQSNFNSKWPSGRTVRFVFVVASASSLQQRRLISSALGVSRIAPRQQHCQHASELAQRATRSNHSMSRTGQESFKDGHVREGTPRHTQAPAQAIVQARRLSVPNKTTFPGLSGIATAARCGAPAAGP